MGKYKNISLLLLGIVFTFFLLTFELFQNTIVRLGSFGYLGSFVAGIFFVSTFTVVPSGTSLFLLGQNLNPYLLAIIAGSGAVIGDLIIFRFVKDELYHEIGKLAQEVIRKKYIKRIVQIRTFSYLLPLVGAIIIASPFPDELGIAMMGLTKIKTAKLVVLTFILNTFGIFLIVVSAKFI